MTVSRANHGDYLAENPAVARKNGSFTKTALKNRCRQKSTRYKSIRVIELSSEPQALEAGETRWSATLSRSAVMQYDNW